MFDCPIAAKEPSAIDAMAMKVTICCQSVVIGANASTVTRTMSAIAASFGAEAKNAVTGVGAPS